MRPDQPLEAVSITNAPTSQTEDVSGRMIKYAISMGIRVACIVAVFFTQGVLMWLALAGAVLLPYFAVLLANAGRENQQTPAALQVSAPPLAPLAPGAGSLRDEDPLIQGEVVITGEVVASDEDRTAPRREA